MADGMGNIILWTVVECDIGIIAGSLPMLRKLIKSLDTDQESNEWQPHELTLLTVGRIKGRHRPAHDTDLLVSIVADSGADDSSTREIMKATKEAEQGSTKNYVVAQ